jgi:mono/diheme cytochrome c family protein
MKRSVAMGAIAVVAICGAAAGLALAQQKAGGPAARKEMSADARRGRYLVQIAGCNDCHTAGYAAKAGDVDERLWLTGDTVGWRGSWGTTYPSNLRLVAQYLTEDDWVKRAASKELRPPMPWFNLRDMTDRDVRAIYRYLRWLGPAGQAVPAFVPPGRTPGGPFIQFPEPPAAERAPAKK